LNIKFLNIFRSFRYNRLFSPVFRFSFFLLTFHFLLFPSGIQDFATIYAQVLSEDLNAPVYNFIEKLAVKKAIDVNQTLKPYSKKQIAKWLKELEIRNSELNELERHDLEWYLDLYDLERGENIDKFGNYNYLDNKFKFRAYPIIGYKQSGTGSKNGHSRWIGARIEGNYDKLSLMLEYLDTGEFGNNVDELKNVSPRTGHSNKGAPNGIEFSDVKGRIGYDFGFGSLSLNKDYVNIGSGRFGQLIHSSKAASYPYIEFKFKPTEWFELYYMHGWLNSQVLDSNNFYNSYQSEIEPRIVESFIDKYIALNYISVFPYDWLTFSLGNSFIYSGSLRPEMFIPVMYYKVMDHNSGRGDVNDGNGIIFFDLNINYFKNLNFYSTLLIDVLEIRPLLDGEFYKQWFGFTIGGKIYDVGLNNLNLFLEYSKLNPWIYDNKYSTTTYKHLDYVLGHWIGNNADLLSVQIDYKFMRSLTLSLKTELMRKGGELDNYFAYEDKINLPFLFGKDRNDFNSEFTVLFNPIQKVYLKAQYNYSEIEDELEGRTLPFLLGDKHSFIFSLSYGLP